VSAIKGRHKQKMTVKVFVQVVTLNKSECVALKNGFNYMFYDNLDNMIYNIEYTVCMKTNINMD